MFRGIVTILLAISTLATTGCTGRNPFRSRRAATTPATDVVELSDLRRRVGELQSQNNDLEKDRANRERELALMKEQLRDTATRLKDLQARSDQAQRQLNSLRASTRFRGGATITANNSLQQPLRDLGLTNVEVVQNQGVVRVRLPADQLFQAGSMRLKTDAYRTLDGVTSAVGRNYPGQPVAIEGHTERMAGGAGRLDAHHLSVAQAQAVFDAIRQSRRSGLQSNRLFIVGMGDNFPLNDRAFAQSRRIEIVIYPK